jgi:quercetin dioxygenase-like cupin family protein
METINGCAVVRSSEASDPVRVGPTEVDGAYVIEVGMFPAGQPALPLHLHPQTDETFYIADGDVTFQLGERQLRLASGALVFVPRGTTHTAWNSGDRPVRGLLVISPGDAEHMFVPVEID